VEVLQVDSGDKVVVVRVVHMHPFRLVRMELQAHHQLVAVAVAADIKRQEEVVRVLLVVLVLSSSKHS
jgi:hypothetical protein